MWIDVLYLIFLIAFLLRGYLKGVVVALFAVISIILGIFCAMKFSHVVAQGLFKGNGEGSMFIPFLSYVIVFALVVVLVRLGAKAIDKALSALLLGVFNRLAGALLYGVIATLVFSSFLWFINQFGWINPDTMAKSYTGGFLLSFAPDAFAIIGKVVPAAKELFSGLTDFSNAINAGL